MCLLMLHQPFRDLGQFYLPGEGLGPINRVRQIVVSDTPPTMS